MTTDSTKPAKRQAAKAKSAGQLVRVLGFDIGVRNLSHCVASYDYAHPELGWKSFKIEAWGKTDILVDNGCLVKNSKQKTLAECTQFMVASLHRRRADLFAQPLDSLTVEDQCFRGGRGKSGAGGIGSVRNKVLSYVTYSTCFMHALNQSQSAQADAKVTTDTTSTTATTVPATPPPVPELTFQSARLKLQCQLHPTEFAFAANPNVRGKKRADGAKGAEQEEDADNNGVADCDSDEDADSDCAAAEVQPGEEVPAPAKGLGRKCMADVKQKRKSRATAASAAASAEPGAKLTASQEYSQRKKKAIHMATLVLQLSGQDKWLEFFQASGKSDDLADSLLHTLYRLQTWHCTPHRRRRVATARPAAPMVAGPPSALTSVSLVSAAASSASWTQDAAVVAVPFAVPATKPKVVRKRKVAVAVAAAAAAIAGAPDFPCNDDVLLPVPANAQLALSKAQKRRYTKNRDSVSGSANARMDSIDEASHDLGAAT